MLVKDNWQCVLIFSVSNLILVFIFQNKKKTQTYNFLILWLNQSIQNLQFVINHTFCLEKNYKKCVFHLLK